MQKQSRSLSLFVVCALSLAACNPAPPEKKISADYQAPVASVATPTNLHSVCYSASDLNAFRVRMVQQELVVAALQCKGADGKIYLDDEYAAFIKKFRPELSSNANELQSVVKRKKANLDVMVTEIANRTAQRPVHDREFCSRHQRAFDWALLAEVTSLTQVPAPYDLGPEMKVFPCPKG
ncbi:MAG: hypothetical protein K2X72_26890 [Reyranella sp.]|nr:hypothetical protein [Reyranella sp.]